MAITSPGWVPSPTSTRVPIVAGRPLTVTAPRPISVSIARRDPMPASASTFCSFWVGPTGTRAAGAKSGGKKAGG